MPHTIVVLLDWLRPVFIGVLSGALTAFGTWWNLRAQMRDQLARDLRALAANFADSHASTVAFDKYVVFCESYTEAVQTALGSLSEKGPSRDAMRVADDLLRVRRAWSLWVPRDVSEKLAGFEKTIRQIGLDAAYAEASVGVPGVHDGAEKLRRMYKAFSQILGLREWHGESLDDEYTFERVAEWLQDTLGIETAHALRRRSGEQALTAPL